MVDDFLIMEQIGPGASSTVQVCQHIPTGITLRSNLFPSRSSRVAK
jgi:hypothetical protein